MRRLRYIVLPLLLAMVFACAVRVQAQVALPSLAPAAAPANLGIRKEGLFDTARVAIDGSQVFRIAALASPPPGGLPLDTRLLLVQGALNQVLATDPSDGATVFDPKTLVVNAGREASQYVISATDAKHSEPVAIVTVTSTDAQFAGMSDQELAQQWKTLLQPALVAALERRQPAQIERSRSNVIRNTIVGGIATLLLLVAAWLLRKRARPVAVALVWLVVVAWGVATVASLLLFPQTVALGLSVIRTSVRVAIIWISAWVIDRVLSIIIKRAAVAYARRTASQLDRERHLLRAPTISSSLGGFKRTLVFFIAALTTLSQLSIPIASVITIGGIAALAFGFAAQTLVRDCLNGLLVLFEDQYVVGDYVMIGDYNGMVEKLTLRIVQVRDSRGNLITIPHSSVTQVVNASRTWARVDYRVAIDSSEDLGKAVGALRTAFEATGQDEAWRDAVIESVEFVGVELLSKNGVILRASMRCAPLRQFELRRAINARVLQEFAREGIALGVDPQDAKAIGPAVSPNPI
jgi:moderate conductance mechanosensitive channel